MLNSIPNAIQRTEPPKTNPSKMFCVMVVDPDMRRCTKGKLLCEAHPQVAGALAVASVLEAEAQLRSHRVDFLIMDESLGKTSLSKMLTKLRAEKNWCNIKVLMLCKDLINPQHDTSHFDNAIHAIGQRTDSLAKLTIMFKKAKAKHAQRLEHMGHTQIQDGVQKDAASRLATVVFREKIAPIAYKQKSVARGAASKETEGEAEIITKTVSHLLFGCSFTPEERALLGESAHLRYFSPGRVLMTEGEEGNIILLIAHGQVQVYHQQAKKREAVALLGSGDIVGELAALNHIPRAASVEGTSEGFAIAFSGDKLLKHDHPLSFKLHRKLLNTAANHLRRIKLYQYKAERKANAVDRLAHLRASKAPTDFTKEEGGMGRSAGMQRASA